MKKTIIGILMLFFTLALIGCDKNKEENGIIAFYVDDELYMELEIPLNTYAERPENPISKNEEDTFDGWYKDKTYSENNRWFFDDEVVTGNVSLYGRWVNEETEIEVFKVEIDLPSLRRLDDASEDDITVVEDAPDLLIIGVVLDTFHYFQNEAMSGYEYIKVFNNTQEPYNLKDHRIVLADPLQGQNGESQESQLGEKVLVTGYLFNAYIDEDIVIAPLSTILIWLKPYYWTIGSGTGAYNKTFSGDLVHTTIGGKKGAFEQTVEDFREFWELEETTKVYEMINQPMIAIREESGTEEFFPMITPGGGTPYTHLNASLLRSIEIQKFNNQEGTARVEILNKYSELSPEEQETPKEIFGKRAFNTIHILDNDETVDIYTEFENAWKYFDPVVRAQIHGLINIDELSNDLKGTVNFRQVGSDTNPGIKRWDNTVEIQYRPPKVGERIMQMIVPLRELKKIEDYVSPTILEIMRVVDDNNYRWEKVEIYLVINPEEMEINWRKDEIKSPGRMSVAAPNKIKKVNLTRP